MESYLTVNLKGKVQCSSILWQDDTFAMRREHHDVIIVERCRHSVHIVHLVAVIRHILQHSLEFLQPSLHVLLCSFSRAAKT